ncbi:MAG: ATP-dependent DNA helicase [Lentilactobacillus diolivorans]|jgi:ATP-dependent DNA helicase RecQ|nr:ATP-dependent DNA helicase [Lentilactobacillus diolivorans]RRG04628.1 MAG: ATP-dependent DNA helicase RecQ [Lactobacillus sp.]
MVNLLDELYKYFGFRQFRPGQEQVIQNLIARHHTLAVLPTGGGKTLLYQLYGAISHQRVVIVSPLISLMQDQVSRLQYLGSKHVVALTSTLDFKQRWAILTHLQDYQFIYVSPEMLSNPKVIAYFRQLSVGLFVIDEAHCISEWGPDFRPDYLRLGQIREQLNRPLTLMMTATATQQIQKDILSKLGFASQDVQKVVLPVDRPNIFLSAKMCENQKSKNQLLQSLVSKLNGAGIIYFSSKSQAEQTALTLNRQTGKRVMAYHGGMDSQPRFRIQQQFMNDEIDVICATSAFGMGIDKDNIRFVIHYHLPSSIQNYVQEIGRCGRDQQPSLAILLYEPNDRYLQTHLIENNFPEEELLQYLYQHPDKLTGNDAFKVIKYYYDQHYSFEKIQKTFRLLQQHRLTELNEMLAYVETTGCRRASILSHFNEQISPTLNPKYCCDHHYDFWRSWETFNDQYLKKTPITNLKSRSNWRTILDRLFLLKN